MKLDEVLICSTICFKTKSLFTKGHLSKTMSNWSNARETLLILRLECVREPQIHLQIALQTIVFLFAEAIRCPKIASGLGGFVW